MMQVKCSKNPVIMTSYRCSCKFKLALHFILLLNFVGSELFTHFILYHIVQNSRLAKHIRTNGHHIIISPGMKTVDNIRFVKMCLQYFFLLVSITWLYILLLCSGDVQPNPGPLSSSMSSTSIHSSSSTMSTDFTDALNVSHNLSFVHYNVQSIVHKLDILHAELIAFDILAFSETWLNPAIASDDLILQTYGKPERKDRDGDSHGGVLIYVKSGLRYKRRDDLEIRGIESIWIELANHHKRILFGLFYRPPDANANCLSQIEDSIALAVDTGISDIIIL